MENIDAQDHDSSAYKLMSNFNTNDDHQKSIIQLQQLVKKQNTSCNVEFENFYEQELEKLRNDL